MNILFITSDQWRAECLSRLNHPIIKTPNIDSLASEGVQFTKHYSQATPCSPSRTSLHTGTYLHNHRVCLNGTPFDARYTNWAQELRNAGYDPYLIGYTDTGRDPRGLDPADRRLKHYSEPLPGIRTDTVYRDEVPENWVNHLKTLGYTIPETLWDLYQIEKPADQGKERQTAPQPLSISTEHHETQFMVDECSTWIEQQQSAWVVHLSLLRPHPPFVAPEPYNTMYDPSRMDDYHRRDTAALEGQQHPWLEYQLNQDKFRAPGNIKKLNHMKASYFGLMSEVDDNLGRLFSRIKQLGQWDNTLVIFTSDHGEQMGDHWLMSKSGYFDASYHIPLIIRDPRAEADGTRGSKVDRFTENIDLMPTLLECLNIEIPSQCDGFSLLPFIQHANPEITWRSEVHWEYDFRNPVTHSAELALDLNQHQCAMNIIRDDNYKYVHFTSLPPLFFDLTEDPHEFCNLANHPDYQGLVLHYAQKLISWRMNSDDRGLSETFLSAQGPITRPTQSKPT